MSQPKISAGLHHAEKTLTRRARDKGLRVVFSGPEADRQWDVYDRVSGVALGICYPQRGYGYIDGARFEFATIAQALDAFRQARGRKGTA